MVFARTKMVLEDKCFEEDPGTIEIRFVGPGVTKLYRKMHELMVSVFSVPLSEIQETRYEWGVAKDKNKFRMRWWLHKDLDINSYLYIRFDLNGEGTDEKGNCWVVIKGWLRTEYPQDTVWQRSLPYEMIRTFWHRIFYRQKREEYIEECRHTMILYEKEIKKYMEELRKGIAEEPERRAPA